MFYISFLNYLINSKKNIISCNFLKIFKNFKFFKIKKKKKIFLNVKQTLFLFFFFKIWKKNLFKNNILLFSFDNNDVSSHIDGLFKLYLISKGFKKNNTLNLNKIFLFLKNLIWTNIGCFDFYDFKKINLKKNNIIIESIDKIPFLSKFLIPKNIRISNINRVRLGSYISNGTTIMSEGYVNFNTFVGQNCMIEGRISSGVSVFDNTDIGGSASIMGTLSGGGNDIISIGNCCLLGANSGTGISLGNNCIIESGLYITSGTKILLFLNEKFIIVKAKKLSFLNNLIFYRNSLNGKIECCKNKLNFIKINKFLHKN